MVSHRSNYSVETRGRIARHVIEIEKSATRLK